MCQKGGGGEGGRGASGLLRLRRQNTIRASSIVGPQRSHQREGDAGGRGGGGHQPERLIHESDTPPPSTTTISLTVSKWRLELFLVLPFDKTKKIT